MAFRERVSISQLPSNWGDDNERDIHSVDTIVVHSIYNPEAEDPYSIEAVKAILDQYEVSSHFVIDRTGKVWQLVGLNHMAWHAGASKMPPPDGREKVNLFSIGIELIGNKDIGYTPEQYASLAKLTADLRDQLAIQYVTGHLDIAPGRKDDPQELDWMLYQQLLTEVQAQPLTFLRLPRD